MSKEEFNKTFTKKRLYDKWNRKFQTHYEFKTKKFFSECQSTRAQTARIQVKEFLDPDIFERKKPNWNNSTKINDKTFKKPLNKTIFDVKQGFTNQVVTALKPKK